MDFVSESTAPVHPRVMEAVAAANEGFAMNFDAEPWTSRMTAQLRRFFGCDLDVFLVQTGTAANAIALGALTPPYGSIFCHRDAHIETDECGAPEMFTFGARQIPLPGEHGRIGLSGLRQYLEEAKFGNVHALQPAAISIANLTEAGTAYTPDQVREISELAKSRGLLLHMDGARFANAVASTSVSPAEVSWKAGVDVLVLGTTKSGTLGAEAIISFRPELSHKISFLRKRGGHFAARSRLLAAQVEAYLHDDLWLENARHANRVARYLGEGLARCPNVQIVHPTEGNQVFVSMPDEMTDMLVTKGVRFHRDWRLHPRQNRFVMSWASSLNDADALIRLCERFS